MTVERAVNLLTQENEDTVVSAASHIQNQCCRRDDAKKIVCLFIYLYALYFLLIFNMGENYIFCILPILLTLLTGFKLFIIGPNLTSETLRL